jgi:hypothetical protein
VVPHANYTSYLLRLRRLRTGDQGDWVASVESTTTGEQRSFPSVETLVAFLLAEFGRRLPEDDRGTHAPDEPPPKRSAES